MLPHTVSPTVKMTTASPRQDSNRRGGLVAKRGLLLLPANMYLSSNQFIAFLPGT